MRSTSLFMSPAGGVLARVVRVLEWHHLGQFLPWVVLVISLALTYHLWDREQEQTMQDLRADFDSRLRDTFSNVEQRMVAREQLLRGVQGLFASSDKVDRNRFYSYVSSLHLEQTFPGVQGLGYAGIVLPGERARHVAEIRREGLPQYDIFPEGQREIYAAAIFVEPLSESNLRSLGYDSYADPVRRTAMDLSRDTDKVVISGKVLLQETDGHVRAGFLMFLPVYRNGAPHSTVDERRANIVGWVYASSLMDAMMDRIRGEGYADIDIEVHDGDDISDESLLYDSDISKSHLSEGSVAMFREGKLMEVGSHYWTLAAHSLPGFDYQIEVGKARFVAYAGVGAGVLLALLTGLLVYGRARALADAEVIRKSGARYRQMFEENASIAYLLDPETGRIVDANAAAAAFWGYSLDELRGMNIAKISIAPGGKIVEVLEKLKDAVTHRVELLHRTKSGELRDVEVFSGPLVYEGKTLRYSIAHDISARKRAEEGRLLASTVFDTVEEAVLVTNTDNNIVAVNPAFTAITGFSAEDVMGKNPRVLSSGKHPPEFFRKMWDALGVSGNWQGEIWDRRKNGELYVKWLSIKLVRDDGGKITHHVGVFSDISERKMVEERMQYLTYHDVLTGLPNRVLFTDRLHQAIVQARRDNTKVALMLVNLDEFGAVNENYGYASGDVLLKEVAQRMRDSIRESDTIARVGGDEYILFLFPVVGGQDVARVAEKLLQALGKPFAIESASLRISASIGIAVYPEHGQDEKTLTQAATTALRQGKKDGGGKMVFYRPDMG